jgi:hypothetical protein
MTVERCAASPAGRLVRVVRTGEGTYRAFVPDPLPPQLEFDFGLVAALSAADRALGELAGLGRTMPNPHLLIGTITLVAPHTAGIQRLGSNSQSLSPNSTITGIALLQQRHWRYRLNDVRQPRAALVRRG